MFFDIYKQLCMENGKTPNGVAKELGFASPSVTQWKHGATPRAAALKKIADHFEVSIGYLLGNEQKEDEKKPTPVSESGPLYPPEYDLLSPEDKELVDNMIRSLAKKK